MTFTNEERAVLGELERVFGPVEDANPLYVESIFADSYKAGVRNYLRYAVTHFKNYEVAIDPELPTIKTRLIEEKRKADMEKNAARTIEKRESQATSILAGLSNKARRAGDVSLEIDDEAISLIVQGRKNELFELTYDRADGFLRGHLLGDVFDEEDWTVLSGNARPVDQSGALAAVHDYLDGLVAEDA